MILATQYLEPSPDTGRISPAAARARLRAAFARLPLSHILLGWDLPSPLVAACREETQRQGAQLFRWHPLLTGDATLFPRPEWRTVGLAGEPVPGFQDMAEFTFLCPNRPAVRQAVLDHLGQAIDQGRYDGVFLDRIRYPSPAADPARWLACFCPDCHRAAAESGLDLGLVRQRLRQGLVKPSRRLEFPQVLLGAKPAADPDLALFSAFLEFRQDSVSRLVAAAADLAQQRGLAVGLDCFSPVLTPMVGQDLAALNLPGCWIKVMIYGHTYGPAGLPFELLALGRWLAEQEGISEAPALARLSRVSGLPLPADGQALRDGGLAPEALRLELQRARAAGVTQLLAGIELVEIAGVTRLAQTQIRADLAAIRGAADGLVLSWDLWHMPLDRLSWVAAVWREG